MNLSKYKIPLGSLPAGAQEVANQKTKELEFINYRFSPKLVQDDLEDGVYKDLNHSYFVKCTTRMDGEFLEGSKKLARYHDLTTGNGIVIVEADDPTLVIEFARGWSEVCDSAIVPVVDDKKAMEILTR